MLKAFYYRYLRRYKLFRSLSFLFKRISYELRHIGDVPGNRVAHSPKSDLSELIVAVICDDMTWANIKDICQAVYLTPDNWETVFSQKNPDVFFCESAWQGLSESHCWDGLVAKYREIWGENRFALKKILAYCRKAQIPTVFWNKEDPSPDTAAYCFTDTAMLFDHIGTTASECIPRYLARGSKSVRLLPMGFSPNLFYPLEEKGAEQTAVFFGSWYAQYPARCKDTEAMLDAILAMGMELTIYDRLYGSGIPGRAFPEKYRPYIKSAVPYEEVRNELKKYQYAVNLNTEKDSETMFARRVFEVMACGRMLISNESRALRRLFPDTIWFLGDSFDHSRETLCIQENQRYVMENETFQHHFHDFLQELTILSSKRGVR